MPECAALVFSSLVTGDLSLEKAAVVGDRQVVPASTFFFLDFLHSCDFFWGRHFLFINFVRHCTDVWHVSFLSALNCNWRIFFPPQDLYIYLHQPSLLFNWPSTIWKHSRVQDQKYQNSIQMFPIMQHQPSVLFVLLQWCCNPRHRRQCPLAGCKFKWDLNNLIGLPQ